MSSKSVITILSYTVSKLVRFFETQCISLDRKHLRVHREVTVLSYQPSSQVVQVAVAFAESQVHALHLYGQATNTNHLRRKY